MQAGRLPAIATPRLARGRNSRSARTLQLGLHFHLAKTREQAIREITPIHEEHVKMFAPLGFVPGLAAREILSLGSTPCERHPIFWRWPGEQGRRR